MLQLAQIQGSAEQFEALFRQAVKMEPTYYYFYRVEGDDSIASLAWPTGRLGKIRGRISAGSRRFTRET